MNQIVENGIIGAAIGDAFGVPYEFRPREQMILEPATKMVGNGTHNQPLGTWSDDTSMILATMDSMINGLDYNDIMQNFSMWLYDNQFTPRGLVFDVGRTTEYAISKYKIAKIPALECGDSSEKANGNGSLMRILPFVLYCCISKKKYKLNDSTAEVIHNGSAITHSHIRSKLACGIYASVLFSVIKRQSKKSISKGLKKAYKYYSKNEEFVDELKHFERMFDKDFANIPIENIKSSGYVVDSLEAAIWCALTTESYEESVLKAVNLGGDTDTIASITGGLTGILYKIGNIPCEWKANLLRMDYIRELCDSFTQMR